MLYIRNGADPRAHYLPCSPLIDINDAIFAWQTQIGHGLGQICGANWLTGMALSPRGPLAYTF